MEWWFLVVDQDRECLKRKVQQNEIIAREDVKLAHTTGLGELKC